MEEYKKEKEKGKRKSKGKGMKERKKKKYLFSPVVETIGFLAIQDFKNWELYAWGCSIGGCKC